MIQTKLEHVKKVYNHVKSNRNKSEYSKRRCDYAEYYKKCKVKNIVLYEAFAARGMLCSPYALFKEFMNRSDFDKYEHVWAIYDMEDNEMSGLYSYVMIFAASNLLQFFHCQFL